MMSAIVSPRWSFSIILFLRRILLFEDVEDEDDKVRSEQYLD